MVKKTLLQAREIKVIFGEQEVLDFEEFSVQEGEKIGLVGANGAGKTTLLRVLSGELSPQEGKVERFCEPFLFRQFSEDRWSREAPGQTGGAGAENMPERAGGTGVEEMRWQNGGAEAWETDYGEISGKMSKVLGIKEQLYQERVSGGEDTRIRLAEVFSSDRPLVFFDEPTTNLDRKGIAKLKELMRQIPTMILVSHDRALLNEVCTRIVEVADGELVSYEGNYDTYASLKQAALDRQWSEYENYTREKKRLEKVIVAKKEKARAIVRQPKNLSSSDRKDINFGGKRKVEDKARGMERAAANVEKRIAHMDVKEKPKEQAKIRPDFRLTNPPENRIVISGEHVNFSYGDGRMIYADASFSIRNGARVAVVGDNGAGKTTLLHLILQAYEGGREDIRVVPKASIGLFEQNFENLNPEKTVLENVMEVSVQKEEVARMILARLLLSARDMTKKVRVLSGGERIKLAFAKLFVDRVNLLILDEPTNYLDIPSVEALEEMFAEYEGTLLFVSHDEAFIRSVATEILVVEDGKITPFYGTPDEYFA